MAIYHLSVKVVSRGKGQSAVAKAAYNSRSLLKNENTGERHDYRRQGEVLFSGIFAPKGAPEWAQDRQALWSAVEKRENRKNSQLAREIEIALPHELTDEQRKRLVRDFVRENFVRQRLVADVAIHAPSQEGDKRNYHAHILVTMREVGAEGFGEKRRDLNSKAQLKEWREKWERLANRYLERHGHEARIDRRRLDEQGIEREPTVHLGVAAAQLERKGIRTERGDINREIAERNRDRESLRKEGKLIEEVLEEERERLEESRGRTEGAAERRTAAEQERLVEEGIEKTISGAVKVLEGLTKPLDAVLDFFIGAPPETPEQKRAKRKLNKEVAKRAEEKAKEKEEKEAAKRMTGSLEEELHRTKFTAFTHLWRNEREEEQEREKERGRER